MDGEKQLSKNVVERYCRQIILPEIGPEGQAKISNAKVLVVGAGGLGSPCLLYLAGAGIGEIGIVDGDCVDTSNLHRQIIHATANKGINKAKSADALVKAFNPMVKVNIYEEHLNSKNAIEICKDYDCIVDCCDNPATRYLTNDISVVLNKPLISGSAVKWEGQLTVYNKDSITETSNRLPCYRCLFPTPTPTSAVCNCSDSGVFGPVPGVIGTLQANETIKLILGASDKILAKRMLMYDGYEMTFKVFKLRNNKEDCETCGLNPKITIDNISSFDYDEFVSPKHCRVSKRVILDKQNDISWKDFKDRYQDGSVLIDVRPSEQYSMFKLKDYNFRNIPLKELKDNFSTHSNFDKSKDVYIMCRAGNQSTYATKLFLENGFEKVYNIIDGLHSYKDQIDDNTPYY